MKARLRRTRTTRTAAVALACAALVAPACNRGPAQDALAELAQSLAAARPELEEYAPESLAAIDTALAEVRERLDQGRYTDALRIAQGVPVRIDAARAAAASQKQVLLVQWPPLASSLRLRTTAIASRLAELAAAPALPKGLDPDGLATARAAAAPLERACGDAAAAAEAGEVARALRLGRAALAQADTLTASLGMGVISLPAPKPSPSPR